MIYAHPFRTRPTDCGPDRWITLPSVISYMEDLRWEWLRIPELGLLDAIHAGHGFYTTRQQIVLARRFGQGIDGHVRGVLRKVGRVEARADQDVVRDDGVLLAHCRIQGVWTSPEGALARIPRSAREAVSELPLPSERGVAEAHSATSFFDPPQPLRPLDYDLEAGDPPTDGHRRALVVRATDCDLFGHVNAANYVRWVADSLAAQGASPSIHRADLHYSGQALGGDEVVVHTRALPEHVWDAAIHRGDELLFRARVQTEATHDTARKT